jgi:hypothetical protein
VSNGLFVHLERDQEKWVLVFLQNRAGQQRIESGHETVVFPPT